MPRASLSRPTGSGVLQPVALALAALAEYHGVDLHPGCSIPTMSFTSPMAEAWDNVVYPCSMMLLFRNSDAVAAWCERHGKPQGDVRPVAQIWHFAREWYRRHLDADWRKWTSAEAAAMFERHGLDGPNWS